MRSAILVLVAACIAAACAYNTPKTDDQTAIDAEIAARQGEEVDNLCFTRDIHGWRELGRSAVLVEKGVNDWYKLDLIGTCRPDQAFNFISIRQRPSAGFCLSKGDTVTTYTTPTAEQCAISAMHKWDEKAPVPTAQH